METTTNRPTGDCQATTGRPPKDPPDTTARSDQRIGITVNRASAGTREREHLMRPGRNLGAPLRKGSHARSRARAPRRSKSQCSTSRTPLPVGTTLLGD